ncbi:MAG: B12-binding domain-containing radical SAM protein [Omnitrophica WOR_2 bacterium RIFCSPLOWO2_02_FULL_50_19]|nr:MAG: B12-binding domain-containing radical SAM protein [Omnitrophica WOR_2 bacterium RIFCSPLOWO2_02_FULL_50_19]
MKKKNLKVLLVVYDNESYIHQFPLGLGYIGAVLEREGYDVEIYNQDMYHYPEEHLTGYLDKNKFDFIGISVIAGYYQYRKLLKISEAINKSRQRPYYILGGHGPSPEPEFFLKKTGADAAIIGEGELTVVDLLDAVTNRKALRDVLGVAFLEAGKAVVTGKRKLIKDIDSIPFPAYHLFPVNYYRLLRMPHAANNDFVLPLLSGRGCTFTCTFCYRMDEGFRPRNNASIIEEIKFLKADYGITYIAFFDELLMSSAQRTVSLCEDFIKAGLNVKWDCNGRLNYARPDVLKLMKRAGCVFINYGIEAMDDAVLKNMKKGLTVEQIIKGIEATLKEGISPGFNIIFGNIGDNRETLNKGVEFLLKYDDGAQMRTIRPVTPYPGSPLYYHAIEKGLLKGVEDFYENKHLNSDLLAVNFTELSDDDFHAALFEANSRLLKNYFMKKTEFLLNQAKELYFNKNASFRGYRQT